MPEISTQDLESCNELIIHLILKLILKLILTLILKDTVKTEQKKINELRLLEEKIFFITLRNKHQGRPIHIIKEEEIELGEHTKKVVDEIEKLKEGADGIQFQSFKTLEDLNTLKHEEAAAIAEIEQKLIKSGISKELIIFFLKIDYSK